MPLRRGATTESIDYDDLASQITGQDSPLLQQVIEKLDSRQDKDEATHFRPENVKAVITFLTPPQTSGWYLYEGVDDQGVKKNDLILFNATVITTIITPQVGDTVIISDGITFSQRYFVGGEWKENEIASPSQISFVIDEVDQLPLVVSEGDRYLLAPDAIDNANHVAEYIGGEWTYRFPEEVKALYLASDDSFREWESPEWVVKIYPFIKLKSDLVVYLDSINGSDNNNGLSTSTAVRTPQVLINLVGKKYDFCNTFKLRIKLLSLTNSFDQIDFFEMANYPEVSSIIFEGNTGNEVINMNSAYLFWQKIRNGRILVQKLRIVGTDKAVNLCAVRATVGTVTVKNLEISGSVGYPLWASFQGNIDIQTGVLLDNIDCNSNYLSSGSNCFIKEFDSPSFRGACAWSVAFAELGINGGISSVGNYVKEPGATTTGRKFVKSSRSSLSVDGNAIALPGDQNSLIYGGGVYNGRNTYPDYSSYSGGIEPTLSPTGDSITFTEGEVLLYNNGDRFAPFWEVVSFPQQTINFPTILQTEEQAYLITESTGFSWQTSYPTSTQVCLGLGKSDRIKFTEFKRFLIESSPSSLQVSFNGGIINDEIIPFAPTNTREVSVPSGRIEVTGNNFFVDYTDPHKHLVTGGVITPDVFTPAGGRIGVAETEFNFGRYWDGTNVVTFGGNDASYQYLYYSPHRDNPWSLIIGKFRHPSFNNAIRDKHKEFHVKPDFLGLCALFSTVIGRTDYNFSSNVTRVAFTSHLYSDRNGSAGTTITDGVLRGIPSSAIGTADPTVYHEVVTTDGKVYKSFDFINWVNIF